MASIRNVTKERLAAGELALGMGLRQARTVDIGKIMRSCGYDWLFIDMEHNSMSIDMAAQISVAAQDAEITPIVRVPGFESFHATRALDSGAQGIVVPHVDTSDVAMQMASHCRYPPIGHRSVTGALPQVGFEQHPIDELTRMVNDATLLILMIETPLGLENVESIAAVEGVDCLLVGTSDLTMEMGIPGQYDHPDVVAALDRVASACRNHGRYAGLGGVYDPPLMEKYIKLGMQLILCGSDLAMMMSAAKQRAATMRAITPS